MKKLLKIFLVIFVVSALALALTACGECKKGHTWDSGTVNKAATCTETGTITYKCTVCGETKQETLPTVAHTPKDVSVAPTCTTEGTTGATKCEVCGADITAGTPVAALGHSWNAGEVTTPATCTEEGVKTYACSVCGETKTEVIAATGHTEVVLEAVAATCTESGLTEGKKCSVCGEILEAQQEIAALGHKAAEAVRENEVAATCTKEGSYDEVVKCSVCSSEISRETKTIAKLAHTEEVVAGKAATCTEKGLTEGKKCSVCGTVTVAQEEIAALGHKAAEAVRENEVAATCTKEGSYDEVVKCSVCSAEISRETKTIAKLAHTEEVVPGKAATCTETGLTEGKKCSVCGTVTVEQKEIAALGHKEEVVLGRAATCTEKGLTDGKRCTVCGETTVEQKEIAALGHKEEVVPGKAATCTETGLTDGKRCTVCGETTVEQKEIAALGHKEEVVPGKAATCTETGLTEGKKCSVCGTITVAQEEIPALGHKAAEAVRENEVAATCTKEGSYDEVVKCSVCSAEISRETKTIAKLAHTEEVVPGKAATCTEKGLTEGKKCSVCGTITVEQKEIAALGHKEEVVPGKAATCTEKGLTDGKRCTVCGETTVEQKEIAALGHKEEVVPGKAATCTETGLTEGKKCSVCGTVTVAQEEIAALGHKAAEAVRENEVAATCTKEGSYDEVVKCSVCSAEISRETKTIAKLAHTEEVVSGKAATCTEKGLTDGKRCTVCGETTVAQEEIPAKGHTEVAIPGKEATCTETGLTEGKKCSVCGEITVEQQETPALGHTWNDGAVTTAPTCETAGVMTYTCTVCDATRTEEILALTPGTLEEITSYGAVEGSKITVTGSTLVWYPADPGIGRNQEGWWIGVKLIAPATITEANVNNVKYCNDGSDNLAKNFGTNKDGQTTSGNYYMGCWLPVTPEYLQGALEADSKLQWTYKFDWNGDGTVDQTFTMVVDPSDITLNKDAKIYAKTENGELTWNAGKHLNHTEVEIPAVAATCTEKGLTAGKKCSVCGEITVEQQETPVLGHTWNDGAVTTAPTCETVGVMTYTCTVCNTTRTEEIPALTPGTLEEITSYGAVDGSKITVTGSTLVWYPADPGIGRNQDGWWIGVKLIAPATITAENVNNVKYCNDGSDNLAKNFGTNKDGQTTSGNYYMGCWLPVTPEYLQGALEADSKLQWTYKFDWNGDGTVDQTFTMIVDPSDITLNKDGKIYAKTENGELTWNAGKHLNHTWNAGEVTTAPTSSERGEMTYTCTICGATKTEAIPALDSGSLEEITSYGTVDVESSTITVTGSTLVWYPADTSIGRYKEGWWIGVKLIAPATITAENVNNVKYCNDGSDNLAKNFGTNKDGQTASGNYYMGCWLPVTPEYLQGALNANANLKWTYRFDWNGDGTVDQTFTMIVDPADITLNKDGKIDTQTVKGEFVWKDGVHQKHTEVAIPGKDATCTETGLTEGKKCSVCGTVTVEQKEIAALGHKEVVVPGKAATCTETGLTEGKKCSVCGTITVEQKDIEVLPHTPAAAVRENEVAASCSKAGSYDEVVYCSVCNAEMSRTPKTIDKLAHTAGEAVRENEVAASCSKEGSYDEVVKCSVCQAEISRTPKTIEKVAHTAGEPVRENEKAATCTEAGSYDEVVYCSVCKTAEISRETKTIAMAEHTPAAAVREYEVAASCSKAGSYDEVVKCSVCQAEMSRTPKTIEKVAHTPAEAVRENEKAATCTEAGSYDEVVYCSVCKTAEISRETKTIAMAEHTPAAAVREYEVAASCSKAGSYDEVVYCSVCNAEMSRTPKTIDKLAHTAGEAVRENEKAATCTTEGSYDEVVYCSVCKTAEISRETKTIAMAEHTPAAAVRENEVPATCSKEGSYDEVVYCSVCNTEMSRTPKTIEKVAHTPAEAVRENEKAATCTTAGSYDEVVKCSKCNAEMSRTAKTIDALGHTLTGTNYIGGRKHRGTCSACQLEIEEACTDENGTCTVCNRVLYTLENKTQDVDFSAKGYANAQAVTEVEFGEEIKKGTVTFAKGSNSNSPKYYTSGTAIRMYGGNTMTVSAPNGYRIAKIKLTFGTSDGSNAITVDNGTFDENTDTWTGEANSVTFTVGGSSGNRRFKSIEVIYTAKSCNHFYGEWQVTTPETCTTDGEKTRTCFDCKAVETQVIPAHHTLGELVAAVEPDCKTQTDGNVAYYQCTVCNKYFKEDKATEIADTTVAWSHDLEDVNEVPATATEDGKQAHKQCTVCGKRFDLDGNEITNFDTWGIIPHNCAHETYVWKIVDGNHVYACDKCNQAQTEKTHNPTAGTWSEKDGKHVQSCAGAEGCTLTYAEHEANYATNYTPVVEGDVTYHAQECGECELVINKHTAALGTPTATEDKAQHYQACTYVGCTYQTEPVDHSAEYVYAANGTHSGTCVCGETSTANCTPAGDNNACSACGRIAGTKAAEKTEKIILANEEYTNGEVVESISKDENNLLLSFGQGSNTSNAPKYYDSGTGLRTYNGNTITIEVPKGNVTSVTFVFSASNYTLNDYESGKTAWTGKQASLIINHTSSSQSRIQQIIVEYEVSATCFHDGKLEQKTACEVGCENDGVSADCWYCTSCGMTFADESCKVGNVATITPALGHSYGELIAQRSGNCTDVAYLMDHYYCSVCKHYFDSAKNPVEQAAAIGTTDPNAHSWSDWASDGQGHHSRTCAYDITNAHSQTEPCSLTLWNNDDTNHWTVCDVCGYEDVANKTAHVDNDSNGICDSCGHNSSAVEIEVAISENGSTLTGSDVAVTFQGQGVAGDTVTFTIETTNNVVVSVYTLKNEEITPVDGVYSYTIDGELDGITVNVLKAVEVTIEVPENATNVTVNDVAYTQNTTVKFAAGTELAIVVTPKEGYKVKSVIINGTENTVSEGKYTYTIDAAVETGSQLTINADVVAKQWTLVTDMSQIPVGSQVIIVAAESAVAMSTTQNSNNRGQDNITKNDDGITVPDTVQQFKLVDGTKENTYAFEIVDDTPDTAEYIYAASSSKNYLRTQTALSDNSSWTIAIAADGVATITAQGSYSHNLLQYNKSSSLFSCYASAQQAIKLYVLQ